jgi:hypothetical protein
LHWWPRSSTITAASSNANRTKEEQPSEYSCPCIVKKVDGIVKKVDGIVKKVDGIVKKVDGIVKKVDENSAGYPRSVAKALSAKVRVVHL